MPNRPAFLFYVKDWRTNAKLRRCSAAARGAWIDVLCFLHDSDEYGVLRWPLKDIAEAAGLNIKLLRELVEKNVLKGDDKDAQPYSFRPNHAGKLGEPVQLVTTATGEPCWYSSRFVRDEYIRLRRGAGTQFTPDNQPPKIKPKTAPKAEPEPPPKPPIGDESGDGLAVAVAVAVPKDLPKSFPGGEFLAPNRENYPPPPPPPPLAVVRPIGTWKPGNETLIALREIHRIPDRFVEEQIAEFRIFWKDSGQVVTSWDAKFLQRCAREWKTRGHLWQAEPAPAEAPGPDGRPAWLTDEFCEETARELDAQRNR